MQPRRGCVSTKFTLPEFPSLFPRKLPAFVSPGAERRVTREKMKLDAALRPQQLGMHGDLAHENSR